MKRFLNFSLFLVMFVSVFGCNSFRDQMPDYEKIADKITNRTAEKLKKERKLILIGIGGRMMDDIQMMAMSFNYYHEVNLEQARELLIYAINEYLSDINNNQDIRPYLHEYPFTSKNVEIMIFVYGPDRLELPAEKIYCITSRNGVIRYYTRSDRDHPMCKETYDEALNEIAFSQGLETGVRNTNEKVAVAEAVAKDGAKVSVTVNSFKYSMFQISGEKFKSYESLNFVSNSCGEVLCFPVQADKNGNIPGMRFLPAVIGKSGGICYIDILRDKDAIHIKLPWGMECKNIEND